MNPLQQWVRCPEFIDIGDQRRSIRLLKCDDLYAVRGKLSERHVDDVEMRLAGDDVSILRGPPPSDLPAEFELLPVYAVAKGATPAVATKRIFLRLQEQTTIDTVRADIEALDFDIDDIPAHAPHCAWLEPKSGHVDDALCKLERLRALPRAAHVEPQLLRPRGWKSRA
jgi:hypothetical protein